MRPGRVQESRCRDTNHRSCSPLNKLRGQARGLPSGVRPTPCVAGGSSKIDSGGVHLRRFRATSRRVDAAHRPSAPVHNAQLILSNAGHVPAEGVKRTKATRLVRMAQVAVTKPLTQLDVYFRAENGSRSAPIFSRIYRP